MIFENMDRIIFAGDSVTDMGSAQPVGEGLFDNMGHGYPRVIESLVTATYPELSIRFTNSGISGNTSKDLLARYERDVLSLGVRRRPFSFNPHAPRGARHVST